MEEHVGVELSPTIVFEYGTAASLARYLHALVKGIGGVPVSVPDTALSPDAAANVFATGAAVQPNGVSGIPHIWHAVSLGSRDLSTSVTATT
jgi:hypothetical protein